MCSIVLALTVAGVGMQAFGAMRQSQSQKEMYKYQAGVDRNNQTIANWQAEDALARGERAEMDVRRKTAMLKGSQRASMAARGLDISEGSALNILSDTDWMGEQDALTVRENSKREAWAYQNQARGYGSSANMMSARSDAESPLLAGASSLLSNAAPVAGKWYGSYKTASANWDSGMDAMWGEV